MDIIQDFIPEGRNNRPGIFVVPKWITIHDTANTKAGADAETHAKYLKSDQAANKPVSWHFTVDGGSIERQKLPQVYQHLPLNEVGWHAGDWNGSGNMTSIGIEICENVDGDRKKAEILAAELVAWLLRKLNLTINDVVQHYHWTGKDCPRVLRTRPGGWADFIDAVKFKIGGDKVFKDINEAWYPSLIEQAAELGLIAGYADGTFRPKEPVTREQLIYFLMRYRERDLHQGTIVDLVARWKRSVVMIRNDKSNGGSSIGSGSFVSVDGLILTNRHVVENCSKLTVTWYHGAQYQARLIRESSDVDLALIKVDGIQTNPVLLASSVPKHGEFCLVLGAALALKDSATFGIVSYPERDGHYVQVDAAINPGNSGGACFNLQGFMIGVPTLKFVGATVDNVAYLTGVSEIRKFLGR
jgi:N-acetylmuramoyl-L-alanine amidase